MIKYKLNCKSSYCDKQSEFEAWFQNIDAFEKQKKLGLINCPVCGSDNVVKLLTTPNLKKSRQGSMNYTSEPNKSSPNQIEKKYLSNENFSNITTILRTLKKEIQKNSTYVGDEFVERARLMKSGKVKEKPIHGHGTQKEVQELREEGIDVVGIPWISDDH